MRTTTAYARPLLCLLAMLAGCGEPAATATTPATATTTDAAQPARPDTGKARTVTTIIIDGGGRHWTAQITDSPSAREFLAQLPLTLTLEDYAATEKIATLPRPLTREGAPAAVTPRAGEVGYYAPWGNIVLYHKDGPHSPGLVLLGQLEQPYADLATPGALKVTIRRRDAGR